eukprot:scaffold1695_cov167-Amphora_coffeaeformis.AAC.26
MSNAKKIPVVVSLVIHATMSERIRGHASSCRFRANAEKGKRAGCCNVGTGISNRQSCPS